MQVYILALGLRIVVFEPVLNLTKADKLFAVGTSAETDKAIQKLVKGVGVNPELISGGLRLLVLVLLLALVFR